MRMLTATFIACCVWLITSTSHGQNGEPVADAQIEQVHEEIRRLRDGVLQSIETKNAEALVAFLHDDIVLTTQDGDELRSIRGKNGVRDYIERMLTGPDAGLKAMELNVEVDELTTLYGSDTGVAYGSSNDHYETADGDAFDMHTRWTAAVVNDGGTWKLAALHASSNLFDNPVLAGTRRAMTIVAIVALVAGLAVGWILSRFLGTRGQRSLSRT